MWRNRKRSRRSVKRAESFTLISKQSDSRQPDQCYSFATRRAGLFRTGPTLLIMTSQVNPIGLLVAAGILRQKLCAS